ncbi:1620_t:CDS:2, partial [Acaulospora colombiana]
MNASTSWTGIPRDYREQERLRLEHQIFSNISFEPEDGINNLEFGNEQPSQHRPGFVLPYDEDEDGMEGSEYSLEFPRNPQLLSKDYAPDLSIRYAGQDHEEGETRSTAAHHASAVTFRTGLKGRPYSPADFEYDPDRQMDDLLKGSSNLSFLNEESRYNAPSKERSGRSEFTKRAQGLSKQIDHEKSYKPSLPTINLNPYSQEVKATLPAAAFNNTNTRVFPALSRVHLPDVTGITTAVATPLKGDVSLKRLPNKRVSLNQPNGNATTLDNLTKRLKDIEKENSTSRRRVKELEMELDTCRKEVAQEKTRLQDISRSFGYQKSTAQGSKMQTNVTG